MRVLLDYRDHLQFPDFPGEFPNSWFNEEWAQKIHGQTLERLNHRGGLCPQEMMMNIEKLSLQQYEKITLEIAVNYLLLKAKTG